MPKVLTIAEVLEMEPDMPVPVVRGKLVKLFKPKTGTSEKGDYSFQNGSLSDGKNEIKLVLKDREELPQSYRNKSVVIVAAKSDRGFTGCKTKLDSYNGVDSLVLWVTGTGEITIGTEVPTESDAATAPVPNKPAAQPSSSRNQESRGPAPHDTTKGNAMTETTATVETRQFVARRLSLLKIVTSRALKFAEEFNASPKAKALGIVMNQDAFWQRVTTLYISAENEGLGIRRGFADALPFDLDFETLLPRKTDAPVTGKKPEFKQCPTCGTYMNEQGVCGNPKCEKSPNYQPPEPEAPPEGEVPF